MQYHWFWSFALFLSYFCLFWRVWTNSLHHLHQNPFFICWTLLHLCLQYKSGLWKAPGVGITTFDLVVNKLYDDKGLKSCPSLIISTVSSHELITASVLTTSVCRGSSFKICLEQWYCYMTIILGLKYDLLKPIQRI